MLHVLAADEVAAAARLAVAAVAAEPADADALAGLPALDALADRVDDAGDLVAGDEREGDAREAALLGEHVAVADAAGLDPDEDLAAAGLGHLALDQLEVAALLGHLHRSHRFRHQGSLSICVSGLHGG